jgi:hypothetical protein
MTRQRATLVHKSDSIARQAGAVASAHRLLTVTVVFGGTGLVLAAVPAALLASAPTADAQPLPMCSPPALTSSCNALVGPAAAVTTGPSITGLFGPV